MLRRAWARSGVVWIRPYLTITDANGCHDSGKLLTLHLCVCVCVCVYLCVCVVCEGYMLQNLCEFAYIGAYAVG